MNYKSYLTANYEKLYKIKDILNKMDNNYFDKVIVNEKPLDENTISIVMTACNRSVQTYFTLETISNSIYKNVQVIIIDDSTTDKITVEGLQKYNTHVELVNIKNKFWINPCINYNIGFGLVRGGKVIIQNAEVCHIGDVLNYIDKCVMDDTYHVFNVCAMKDINCNDELYKIKDMKYENFPKIRNLMSMWYQHPQRRNLYFHFLTALTKKTLDKVSGFDIDFALGKDWDDNGFVTRIISNKIKLINVNEPLIGVHQWHPQSEAGSLSNNFNNHPLYLGKGKYYLENKVYLNLTSFTKEEANDIIQKYINE